MPQRSKIGVDWIYLAVYQNGYDYNVWKTWHYAFQADSDS